MMNKEEIKQVSDMLEGMIEADGDDIKALENADNLLYINRILGSLLYGLNNKMVVMLRLMLELLKQEDGDGNIKTD